LTELIIYNYRATVLHTYSLTPTCYTTLSYLLMLRHVSALAVGRLQGVPKFFDMCSLCFKLYCRNSATR